MKADAGASALTLCACLLCSCATYPELPADLQDQAAIVMGFGTNSAGPYEGGTLYTGLVLEQINGQPLDQPLLQYQYRLVNPGIVSVSGHCFWHLRGLPWDKPDDRWEAGSLTWEAQPNHVYTLSADIDEYKNRCEISYFDKAHSP